MSGVQISGCLSQVDPATNEHGFLALIRLVGTVYFKNISQHSHNCRTAEQLFNSISREITDTEKHNKWLHIIRDTVSTVINSEEERVPTTTALWRHWLRTCWVCMMWRNATSADVYSTLPPPSGNGWIQKCTTYTIDWESPEVEGDIRSNIDFFTKGCTCKKGCKTRGCGCKKRGQTCGPSCECHNCKNVHVTSQASTSITIPCDTSDKLLEEGEDCHDSTDD